MIKYNLKRLLSWKRLARSFAFFIHRCCQKVSLILIWLHKNWSCLINWKYIYSSHSKFKPKSNETLQERIVDLLSWVTKDIGLVFFNDLDKIFPLIIETLIRTHIHSELKIYCLITIKNLMYVSDHYIHSLHFQFPDIWKHLVFLADLKDFEISRVSIKAAKAMLLIDKYGEILIENSFLKLLSCPANWADINILLTIAQGSDIMRKALEKRLYNTGLFSWTSKIYYIIKIFCTNLWSIWSLNIFRYFWLPTSSCYI